MVMDESRAATQDIRPLQIGLLNLMPNKERTETQFARLIGATPLQVDLTLVRISNHQSKNVAQDHLEAFYKTWDEIKDRKFDGFIVTGAPIAHLDFEDVGYWDEMVDIMNWTRTNVHTTMFVCWGAQAALHHFYNVQRFRRPKKAFGVYRHQAATHASPYLLGFSDDFAIPVSRINDIDHSSVPDNLEVLINSKRWGSVSSTIRSSVSSLCSTTSNMITNHWWKNICATRNRAWTPRRQSTLSPTTTLRKSP